MTTTAGIAGLTGSISTLEEGGASSFFAGLQKTGRSRKGNASRAGGGATSFAGLLERRTQQLVGGKTQLKKGASKTDKRAQTQQHTPTLTPRGSERIAQHLGLAPSSRVVRAPGKTAAHALVRPALHPVALKMDPSSSKRAGGDALRGHESVAAGAADGPHRAEPAIEKTEHASAGQADAPTAREEQSTSSSTSRDDAQRDAHSKRARKTGETHDGEDPMGESNETTVELAPEAALAQERPAARAGQTSGHQLELRGEGAVASSRAPATATGGRVEAPSRLAASQSAERIAEVVVERLQVMRGEDMQSAMLELNAGELGHIKVQIELSAQGLRVQLGAAQNRTRDQLRAQLGEIGQALEERGIDGAQLEVQASLAGEDAGQGAEQRPGEESGKSGELRERWENAREEQRQRRPRTEQREEEQGQRRRVGRRPAQPADPGGISVVA